jgi:hypothetical protein
MIENRTSAFGIYSTQFEAHNAVYFLQAFGYRNAGISVIFPQNVGSKDFAIGGSLGRLAGIGALAIPGLGPFIAAGPIVAALAGTGGAVEGLTGALFGMGIPEDEAKKYECRVRNGGILLSVHCGDSASANGAKQLLERTGAEEVWPTGEAASDSGVTDKPHREIRNQPFRSDTRRKIRLAIPKIRLVVLVLALLAIASCGIQNAAPVQNVAPVQADNICPPRSVFCVLSPQIARNQMTLGNIGLKFDMRMHGLGDLVAGFDEGGGNMGGAGGQEGCAVVVNFFV